MSKKYQLSLVLLVAVIFGSCKKDSNTTATPTTPANTVPTTYNFTNVDYTAQKKLLAMADQMVVVINLANSVPNTAVSAQKLKDMFNNANNYFNDSALALNASGLKLSDYCSPTAKTDLSNYFDSIALYSQSAASASNGVAGVSASSANAAKKYLLSPTGIFYSQLVKKTIMGGICAYEIANVYLVDSVSNANDNGTVIAGSGTAMEHHWDEAFGFFGVPIDFPTDIVGLKYFGSYSNQVDAGLHSNATVMNAFLKGRAAITGKDLAAKDAQAAIIIKTFEQMDAAAVVQEMKEADVSISVGDAVATYGALSEALGFVRALKYNTSSTRVVTDSQIAQLEALFDSANPQNPNMYDFVDNVSASATVMAKTDAIRQMIGTIYGFNATQLAGM